MKNLSQESRLTENYHEVPAPSPLPAQSPVLVYGSIQFDMPSHISGRTYRIFVFKPSTPPPPAGYPVVVVTDGNLSFPLMATMDAAFELTGRAALVVGVGYPTDDPTQLFSLRTRDLTPPTPLSGIPHRPGQPPIKLEDYGGAENFYRFLTEELRPAIAGAYAVNAADQTLYGHSWGGMFTLNILFNHPASFRTFVAASPSLWWNKRSVLGDVPGFARQVEAGEATPRVLIMVGSTEQDVPDPLPPVMTSALTKKMPFVPSALRNQLARLVIRKMMLNYRMVDNARDAAALLQQIKGKPGYVVRFRTIEGEDHLTAAASSIGPALAFALNA
jgi:predicted alpha/beta superfamily hydrolase